MLRMLNSCTKTYYSNQLPSWSVCFQFSFSSIYSLKWHRRPNFKTHTFSFPTGEHEPSSATNSLSLSPPVLVIRNHFRCPFQPPALSILISAIRFAWRVSNTETSSTCGNDINLLFNHVIYRGAVVFFPLPKNRDLLEIKKKNPPPPFQVCPMKQESTQPCLKGNPDR